MKSGLIRSISRIILGVFMGYAGILHLTSKRLEFQALVPKWLSEDPKFLDFVVLSSGIVEIGLGLTMIFWTAKKEKIGIVLALFLVLVFFGNLSQYTNGIDAFGLDSDQKRLIRLFFQPVLILWALWSTGVFPFGRKNQS